ncbi:hypothetical protein HPB50_004651 [Hyalomma asiaticum]|uniref:Uncharacterized protein n=1 Tax=Hyalomma asiaticum TaxID=266040 RepID=A0ACB7TAI4_HYAAI|nr:hypothetical protein HPB50_004651 [Hyalomma asiaticum]
MQLQAAFLKRSLRSRGLCYRELGCFKLRDRMRLPYGFPRRPSSIGARFWLYCAQDSRHRIALYVASSSATGFAGCPDKGHHRPLVAIVHGFTESAAASWVTAMTRALLRVVGANVLLVDWRRGAAAPFYSVAAVNTPVVGAELSVVLQRLMSSDASLVPRDVHIIGFSLGAHVAGFCGRHFQMHTSRRIGRITALDPAGPLFQGTNVSVSRGDADFVDVIHTNMGRLDELQFGLAASVGDVDFFPNGGSLQPGCRDIACSHRRAHDLMIESITNPRCTFVSRPVSGKGSPIGAAMISDSQPLHRSGVTGRGAMGYDSVTAKGRGIQYIRTRSTPPFCIQLFAFLSSIYVVCTEALRCYRPCAVADQTRGQSVEFYFIFGGICLALGFLGCIVAVLTVVSTGDSYDEVEPTIFKRGDGGESAPSVSVSRSGVGVIMATPPVLFEPTPTSAPRTDATQPTSTLPQTYSTRSVTSTTSTRSTPPVSRWPRSPLICTVSVNFTKVSSLPRDGLCDFIFYESFYLKNKPIGWADAGLDHFLTLAKNLHTTGVGASFSPSEDTLFADALNGSLITAVDNLRRLGVSHFGMLSLYGQYTAPDKVFQCLTILQVSRSGERSEDE